MFNLDYSVYLDKVLGCWYGKSIGGTVGAPVEGHKILGDLTKENCWPDKIYPNDDLDIQVVWLELLEEIGAYPTKYDYQNIWRERCWYNFAEYGSFLYNIQRGIHSPTSGDFDNEFYSESEGCPIRAEIWGCVAPGDTLLAASLAETDGELDHIGESVDAERFWAAAVSKAFTTDDLQVALEAGRDVLEDGCMIAEIYDSVPRIYEQTDKNSARTWRKLVRYYGDRDNSKARTNFAFSILALIASDKDFKQVIVDATNFGWDSDCTAATAGALLGTLMGASKLPEDWMKLMGDVLACDCNVRHKTAPMIDFAKDTCSAGIEMLQRNTEATITNVPADIAKLVEGRIASRPAQPLIKWEIDYLGDPILPVEGAYTVRIGIQVNRPARLKLETKVRDDLTVCLSENDIAPFPGETLWIEASMERKATDIIWDKNLCTIVAMEDGKEAGSFEWGLAGERQWSLYGPYWHAWDAEADEVCPFKNDKVIVHPCHCGHGEVLCHNFVYLDKEYLDEKALCAGALPMEDPESFETGRDWFWTGDAAGFVGEAVYYFVREIVTTEDIQTNISFGSDSPVKVFIDGKEAAVYRWNAPWCPSTDFFAPGVKFTAGKTTRIVVKITRKQDDSRFSMFFQKMDVPGDKLTGISYWLDCTGSKLIKG